MGAENPGGSAAGSLAASWRIPPRCSPVRRPGRPAPCKCPVPARGAPAPRGRPLIRRQIDRRPAMLPQRLPGCSGVLPAASMELQIHTGGRVDVRRGSDQRAQGGDGHQPGASGGCPTCCHPSPCLPPPFPGSPYQLISAVLIDGCCGRGDPPLAPRPTAGWAAHPGWTHPTPPHPPPEPPTLPPHPSPAGAAPVGAHSPGAGPPQHRQQG